MKGTEWWGGGESGERDEYDHMGWMMLILDNLEYFKKTWGVSLPTPLLELQT